MPTFAGPVTFPPDVQVAATGRLLHFAILSFCTPTVSAWIGAISAFHSILQRVKRASFVGVRIA